MKLVASVVGGAAASLAVLVVTSSVDSLVRGQSPQELADDWKDLLKTDPFMFGYVAGAGATSGLLGALIGG